MGGRLDAVNLLDADAAAVVSVGIDHREWLGDTVEAIGREKAGIFRAGRPAIFGGRQVPKSVVAHAAAIGARLRRIGTDFDFVERADGWDYVGFGSRRRELPLPGLAGASPARQRRGRARHARGGGAEAPRPRRGRAHGARRACGSPGRFQVLAGEPEWILDVAHNPQAAQSLAASLAARPCARAHDGRLRDPRRQGRRGHRRGARWADRPLDRGRPRRAACACARGACRAHRPRRRRARCLRPPTSRRAWPPRAPR